MSRPVESQRDQFPHRVAALHTAMPDAGQVELRHKSYSGGGGMVEAYHPEQPTDWKGGKNLVGYLGYEPEGEISYVEVHPDFRGQNIGKAMLDHGRQYHPIHHSIDQTPSGRAWAEKNARTAADWSQPRHLNTPLFSAEDRYQFYHPTEFTDRHQFSPTEFNPMADTMARPRLRWKPAAPEQDALDLDVPSHFSYRPGETPESIDALINFPWTHSPEKRGTTPDEVYPVDRQPQKLYRGINLDLRHPEMQEVHRALWGPEYAHPTNLAEETENPGLFPRPSHTPDPRGFGNTDLGHRILDHISTWHPDVGLGTHWSTDSRTARDFAGHNYPYSQPALISAEWMGRGEDPYRTDAYGDYHNEQEITMMPGAPLRVTQVHLRHPETGKWHPVLGGGPQHREAALDDDEDEENEDEDDGTYCASCGPNDDDWCEACEECKSCDAHTEHCEKCGPNDPDWCESCDTCSHCDLDHDSHCSSCGPNDEDWCSYCGECSHCDLHDKHCDSCGPNDDDWCESCEECKYCGECSCGVNPQPLSLKTPLYGPHNRPQTKNYDSDGNRQYLFLPHEINPASDAESRPYVHFPFSSDEPELFPGLKTSNGMETIPASTVGAEMHRGLTVDLRKPELASLRRAIYGPRYESYYSGDPNSVAGPRTVPYQPGMFPGPFSDKELAGPPADPDRLHQYLHTILGHMSNWSPRRGLGEHWSTSQYQANNFAGTGSGLFTSRLELPVRMTARWRGQGEDPYRNNTGEDHSGQFEEEEEISLLPHAPLTLENLEIFHPKTKQWHSLMDLPDPIRVHAGWSR